MIHIEPPQKLRLERSIFTTSVRFARSYREFKKISLEVYEWCQNNVSGAWMYDGMCSYWFESKTDANLCYLRFR